LLQSGEDAKSEKPLDRHWAAVRESDDSRKEIFTPGPFESSMGEFGYDVHDLLSLRGITVMSTR
jgi:hypothetical protein